MMKTFRAAWIAAVMAAWMVGPMAAAPPTAEGRVPAASGKRDVSTPGKGGPATAGPAQPAAPTQAENSERPQYLLLGDGKMLSGRVEKEGNRYLLRISGGVIPFPADKVMLVADSLEKVYEYRVQRIAVGDLDEHLKLSQWCASNNLPALAEAELVHVLKVDPHNSQAQNRLDLMRRARRPEDRAATASNRPRTRTQTIAADPSGYLVSFTQAHGRRAFERFSVLEMRLLNECGRCHASLHYTGSFRLFRRDPGQPLDQRRSARNLQAVLNNVDFEDPTRSTILYMALNPHGNLKLPSYAGPNDPHFKDLSNWVHEIAESSRSAVIAGGWREGTGEGMPTDESPSAVPTGREADRAAKGGLLAGSEVSRRVPAAPAADDDPEPGSASTPAPTAHRTTGSRKLRDPYDPEAFNEQFAPAAKSKK